jgi:hypothetical protein
MKVELKGQMESSWQKHPHRCKKFSMEKDLSTNVKRNCYIHNDGLLVKRGGIRICESMIQVSYHCTYSKFIIHCYSAVEFVSFQEQAKRPMSRASFVFLHDLLVIIHQ